MDNDTMRRGRPTLHVVAGEGMAILAGDGLLTEAFHLLAREPVEQRPARRRAQAARHRDRRARGRARRAWSADRRSIWRRSRPIRRDAAAGARCRRAARDARTKDRRAHPRVGGRGRDHGRRHRRADRRHRRAPPASSAWRFRSSTTSSTSKASQRTLGKTAGKDAAAGKPTYPALYGLDTIAPHGRRVPRPRRSGASSRGIADDAPARDRPMDREPIELTQLPNRNSRFPMHVRGLQVEFGIDSDHVDATRPSRSARRRTRPGAVARAGAGADPRRTGHRRRHAGDQGRHARSTIRRPSRCSRRIIPTSAAAA